VRIAKAFGGVLLGLLACGRLAAQQVPSSPVGDWLTDKAESVISISPCGAAMCGDINGLSEFQADGSPPRDKSGASECHLRIVRDMVPGTDGRFHGTITDPRDGSVYQAQMWVGDGTLHLRGYVLTPMFGSTQDWARFTGSRAADCHFQMK